MAHPLLRGLGIGGPIVEAAVRRFNPAGGVQVAAFVNVRNTPSLGMFRKVGFGVSPNPRVVQEWRQRVHAEGEYYLMVWPAPERS